LGAGNRLGRQPRAIEFVDAPELEDDAATLVSIVVPHRGVGRALGQAEDSMVWQPGSPEVSQLFHALAAGML
jgi:hypothetical protein